MKRFIFPVLIFVITFAVFNLIPIIPVNYDDGSSKICALNYYTCMHTIHADDFPQTLKTGWWSMFVLPILLPFVITDLLYRYSRRKFWY